MRYFFEIAYKGTRFSGWQRQPNSLAIQEVYEQTIEKVLGQSISCIGCGRTDAGVHARQFFFHIDYDSTLNEDLRHVLNRNLPDDLSIKAIFPVTGTPHAQFDAIERTYHYYLHTEKQPFIHDVSAYYPEQNWNIEKIRECVSMITGIKDFRAFCKTPDRYKDTLCDVRTAKVVVEKEGKEIGLEFTSNRFLRGMIRLLVGAFLEAGRGNLRLEQFTASLERQHPLPHLNFAYPQGLYLVKVVYPEGLLG